MIVVLTISTEMETHDNINYTSRENIKMRTIGKRSLERKKIAIVGVFFPPLTQNIFFSFLLQPFEWQHVQLLEKDGKFFK